MSDDGHSFSDDFDWGFTAVNLAELEIYQEQASKLQESGQESADLQERLTAVYNAIQPLLTNLKANPERDYILWTDRASKIEAFSNHLTKLYRGE
jgi:sensor domain CHASE-containing protein